MQEKIKFIIIAGCSILLLSLIGNVNLYNKKKSVEREKEKIAQEKVSLSKKFDKAQQQNKKLQVKAEAAEKDLEKVKTELTTAMINREELQRAIEELEKEKEELAAKIKAITVDTEEGKATAIAAMADTYWAGILKKKADLELKVENLKNQLEKERLSTAQLQTDKGDLELEVSSLGRQNEDLKRQIEYIGSNQKSIDMLTQELVREKNDKFQIQNSLTLTKKENTLLRRQLKSLGRRNISLEKKIVSLQGKNKEIEENFAKVEALLKDQMLKMANLKGQLDVEKQEKEMAFSPFIDDSTAGKGSVELPPIVVRPKEETTASLGSIVLLGKVMSVDRENNFVIVNLGGNSGVKKGDTFGVYRGNERIADVKVIETRREISACDIKKESESIEVGDTIR